VTEIPTGGSFTCAVDNDARPSIDSDTTPSVDTAAGQLDPVATSSEASSAPSEISAAPSETSATPTAESNPQAELSGFSRFGFGPELLKALSDIGYQEPSPIQKAAIPELMLGRDLVGQAQTGTGKTAAFALPMLAALDPEQRKPQVLVLAPTRELAIQVADAFSSYAAHLNHVRVLAIYGGADFRDQIHQLKRGVQIVVGTPGRVMDQIGRASCRERVYASV
jgi:ATP-dependent RNA helicase DeaD